MAAAVKRRVSGLAVSQDSRTTMLRKLAIAYVALIAAAAAAATPAAQAKEWAQKMFSATNHDFGHVARGAKAEFAFEVQNLYEEDIHIADVRTSCGCTTPTITKPTLKTWEKGSIVATLNTRSFVGQRSSTLTVVIDKPYYAEVQLNIAGFIHSDVDFQPGVASLGDVDQGSPAQQEVVVTYRGFANWQISDVRSANSHLEVELSDPTRLQGMVSYKMVVRLKPDAPPGSLQDQLTIVTNDQRMPTVSLPVEGRVLPPLSINPSPILLGALAPGATAVKQMVVSGKQPFKLLSVQADNDAVQNKAVLDVAKKVHLVPVVVTAPSESGEFRYKISVETDLPSGGVAACVVRGAVRGDTPTAAVRRPENQSR
jgi:hypothetical protein